MHSPSTTIRIDRAVHERLTRLARETGRPLNDTVAEAATALERSLFAARLAAEYTDMGGNPQAWQEYLAAGDLAAGDGVA